MNGLYWLASFPKSGNTWFRTFLRNYIDDADQPADINDLETGNIASSRAWLDEVLGFDTADLSFDEADRLRPSVYEWPNNEAPIGYHKIHEAYFLTPDYVPLIGTKTTLGAVYILRNPLDVAPSYANHLNEPLDKAIQSMGDPKGALAKSTQKLTSQVRQFMGTWSNHVTSWVDAPGLNRLVLRYEDMQSDPHAAFAEAVRFLGLDLDQTRLAKAIRFSSFDIVASQEKAVGFRERPVKTEKFFRKGVSGGWRERLTNAQVAKIVEDHGPVMRRFGYLDARNQPTI